jgi:hypothetical protein
VAAKKAEEARMARMAEETRRARQAEEELRKRCRDLEEAAAKSKADSDRAQRAAEAARREAAEARDPRRAAPRASTPIPPRREESFRERSPSPTYTVDSEEEEVSFKLPEPPGMSGTDRRAKKIADAIRKIHPELAEYPDEFLTSQSVAELRKATRDAQSADMAKVGKRLEQRLQANYTRARENPKEVFGGMDNRSSIRHKARYLGGAAVKGTELWLDARQEWGQHGIEPICNYDTTNMGMAGCVTAKGIETLHNPGSDEISIKMFTVSNVIHAKTGARTITATGLDQFETQENWKDMADMTELKNAYRNLKKAAFMIRPWDYSFEVFEAWLHSNSWMDAELKGFRKASLMGDFVDYIIHENAKNWTQETAFLLAAEIQTHWQSWWCSRKTCAPKWQPEGEKKDGQQAKNKDGSQRGGRGGRAAEAAGAMAPRAGLMAAGGFPPTSTPSRKAIPAPSTTWRRAARMMASPVSSSGRARRLGCTTSATASSRGPMARMSCVEKSSPCHEH